MFLNEINSLGYLRRIYW